jgi:hypothetical protein
MEVSSFEGMAVDKVSALLAQEPCVIKRVNRSRIFDPRAKRRDEFFWFF